MLMTFVEQNWIWIFTAGAAAILLAVPQFLGGRREKTVNEVVLAMNRERAIVLDVRDAEEFDKEHIKGAKNIPLSTLSAQTKEIEAWRKKPVMVVCLSGQRAGSAARTLQKKGVDAWVMQGGMREWQKQNMPTIKNISHA